MHEGHTEGEDIGWLEIEPGMFILSPTPMQALRLHAYYLATREQIRRALTNDDND